MSKSAEFALLTFEERESLRLLNKKLWATEEWIRYRHARSLECYYGAGGLRRHRHSDALLEDVETEVVVQCVLREDHPDWKEDDDNAVATLLMPYGCLREHNPRLNWNEFRNWDAHPLQDEYHCFLFHDLCDHVLEYDWEKLLSIGGIWTDVILIQQRAERW